MTTNKQDSSSESKKPGDSISPAGGTPPEGEYDSAMKPLLMLLVPFVLILLYGYFN